MAGWLVVLTAGVVIALSIRSHTFVAWGTDPASYIESAHRWAEGRPIAPSALQLSGRSWTQNGVAVVPLGFRVGPSRGTDVSEYPFGFAMLMAPAVKAGGELAAYLVTPLAGGLLVAATYWIGAALAGPWAGVLAAVLVGVSPVTLSFTVQVMSDVPAAALWVLAWALGVRPGLVASLASGLAVALAVLVRPNLAPLGLAILPLLLVTPASDDRRGVWTWRRAVVWLAAAAIGPALLLWSQAALYGGVFTSGYAAAQSFFAWAHVPTNLRRYPVWPGIVHTKAIYIGLLAPALAWWGYRRGLLERRAPIITLSAVALAAVNLALYLPYLPFDDLTYIRFLLPALAALYVLLAAMTVWAARALASVSRLLAPIALVPALAVAIYPAYPATFLRFALTLHETEIRAMLMGRYLREALPPNAVVMTQLQSAATVHYTGRPVVRFDLVPPDTLDRILADLQDHGYRPYLLVDEGWEALAFLERFPSSLSRLDWQPRAVFTDRSGTLSVFDFADRARFLAGARWPIDIVRAAN